MSDKEIEDGATASAEELRGTKQHGLFGASGIQLTDEELSSAAATKFLRHLNSTQESDIIKLRSFESQYYDKRQECEILKKEKELLQKEIEKKKEIENLQKVMITFGGILLGLLKFFEHQPSYVLLLMALIGVLLIIGGMFPVLRIGANK